MTLRIPHGPQAQRNYAKALQNLAAGPQNVNVRLVEFWEKASIIEHHESRGRFNWVQDPTKKGEWHKKVTDSILQLNRGFKRGGQTGMDAQTARSAGSHPLDIPKNLTEANLIGYTSEEPSRPALIDLSASRQAQEEERQLQASQGITLPKSYEVSVYYREGHYTLDHEKKTNIGWKDKSGWTLLCFANVPVEYLNNNFVPGQRVSVDLTGLKAQAQLQSPNVKGVVSQTSWSPPTYHITLPNPINGFREVVVRDDLLPNGHHRIQGI